ncbi:MAG: Sfum_1244 family protein [Gammaproteobacteria bacterium]
MVGNLSDLIDTVQKNCMIADARHARDMTMCTFLLEMREYYRWEMEIPYGARLPKDELGDWLNARESEWDAVEDQDFAPLPITETGVDPFEADDVNRALVPQGLVYSSGLGHFRKPHFVLAELKRAEVREGVQVLVAGCEYARDLIAPPAALRDGAIFLRMDAVRRLLWNKFEEWQWKEKDTALGRAFAHYDFERDIERGLDRMAEAESEAMILHEVGEARAGRLLGDDWETMLGSLNARHAELLVRAVRDHLADCLVTLPTLVEREAIGSLHFYLANLSGLRRALFPALPAAYEAWLGDRKLERLADLARQGESHWLGVARQVMDACRADPAAGEIHLRELARGDLASVRL